MFLLDTNALSELEKPAPNAGLTDWLGTVDWLDLYLSVMTVAEIWEGIAHLPNGRRRRSLEAMFNLIPTRFANRILAVDYAVAVKFGDLQAKYGPLPTMDTLIAATALVNRLTVVTHNTQDIERAGVSVFDPWK